jgi:hypothetical protein
MSVKRTSVDHHKEHPTENANNHLEVDTLELFNPGQLQKGGKDF